MNAEQFAGICRQLAGKMNEIVGELSGDPLRAADGRRSQIIGKNQQRKAIAKQQSARQLREFLYRNRNWRF